MAAPSVQSMRPPSLQVAALPTVPDVAKLGVRVDTYWVNLFHHANSSPY